MDEYLLGIDPFGPLDSDDIDHLKGQDFKVKTRMQKIAERMMFWRRNNYGKNHVGKSDPKSVVHVHLRHRG
jgi:hypothetical protein